MLAHLERLTFGLLLREHGARGRTYLGRRDLVIAVPEAGNGCPVCWATGGLSYRR